MGGEDLAEDEEGGEGSGGLSEVVARKGAWRASDLFLKTMS